MTSASCVSIQWPRSSSDPKVFLGMAAGVGKTYRMLLEGQAEAEAGRDVVIGYLEPHGRQETTRRPADSRSFPAGGRLPRQPIEEMDLPAILGARARSCA